METDEKVAGGMPAGAGEPSDAQALAVCLRLAASLLIDEPTAQRVRLYAAERVFDEAPAGGDDADVAAGLVGLRAWCDAFAQMDDAEADAALGRLRSEWLRLFAGAGAPDAPCWATFYLDPNGQMLGAETLKVRACYKAHGLHLENPGAEPDDHLAFMLRFAAFLLEGADKAVRAGDTETACALRAEQRAFAAQHMLPWMARWHYLAVKHAASEYYRGTAHLVFGFIKVYAAGLDIGYDAAARAFVDRGMREG